MCEYGSKTRLEKPFFLNYHWRPRREWGTTLSKTGGQDTLEITTFLSMKIYFCPLQFFLFPNKNPGF